MSPPANAPDYSHNSAAMMFDCSLVRLASTNPEVAARLPKMPCIGGGGGGGGGRGGRGGRSKPRKPKNPKSTRKCGRRCRRKRKKCTRVRREMQDTANEIDRRKEEMLSDLDRSPSLYKDHYSKKDRHPQLGSWVGHQDQMKAKQRKLQKKVNDYENEKNCGKAPKGLKDRITTKIPQKPRGI